MEECSYPLMPTRYHDLIVAQAGFEETGVRLVGYEGGELMPVGPGHDLGISYFIPLIADIFHLELNDAIIFFFYGNLIISLIIGLTGCWLWIRNPVARTYALIVIYHLMRTMIDLGDIYLLSFTVPIAVIPLFMYFMKSEKYGKSFLTFICLTGLAIGTAHIVRSHTATAVLIIMIGIIGFCHHLTWKNKALVFALLAVTFIMPTLYFKTLVQQRDSFLAKEIPDYQPVNTSHLLWHAVYLGLCYSGPNEYGIVWQDSFGREKAVSIKPDVVYPSKEYDRIIRDEVFRLAKTDPQFVFGVMLDKASDVWVFMWKWINIGVLFALFRFKRLHIELSFWAAIAFGSLSGFLVMPWPPYLVSFVTILALYAIASMAHTFDEGPYSFIADPFRKWVLRQRTNP